jgi:hypothetical protein
MLRCWYLIKLILRSQKVVGSYLSLDTGYLSSVPSRKIWDNISKLTTATRRYVSRVLVAGQDLLNTPKRRIANRKYDVTQLMTPDDMCTRPNL